MAKEQVINTSNGVLTKTENDLVIRGLELLRTSYSRAQKQRPEFADVSKQFENQVSALIAKLT